MLDLYSDELIKKIAQAIVNKEIQFPKRVVAYVAALRAQSTQEYLQAAQQAEEYIMFNDDLSGLEPGPIQKAVGFTLIAFSIFAVGLAVIGPMVREKSHKVAPIPLTAPLAAPQI